MGGRVLPDLCLSLRDPGLHLVDRGLGRGDARVEVGQLLVQFPQLAAARNQAAGALPRTDDQRAVGLAKIAGQGDEVHGLAVDGGQLQGVVELLDDPGPAQQPGHQRAYCGCGLDETVGAAHNARLAGQINFAMRWSPAFRRVAAEQSA